MEQQPNPDLAGRPSAPPSAAPRVRIRPATLADVDAILAIEEATFAQDQDQFNRRQVRYLIRSAGAISLVADVDGQVAGWAVGLLRRARPNPIGRIYTLAIHPKSQGLGLGRRLAEHLLAAFKSRGVRRIFLEVRHDNHGAIALYDRLGFQVVGHERHYYGRGRHGLTMLREASDPPKSSKSARSSVR